MAAGRKQFIDMSDLRGIAAQKDIDTTMLSLRTQTEIRNDAHAKLQKDYEEANQNAIDHGNKAVYTQDQINAALAKSDAAHADKVVTTIDKENSATLAGQLRAVDAEINAAKAKYGGARSDGRPLSPVRQTVG